MFSMLSINDDNPTNDCMSVDDIESFCNAKPLNLFPGLESAKSMGPGEVDKLQKECAEIEKNVKEIEKHMKDIVHEDVGYSNVVQDDFKQSAAFMSMNLSILSQKKRAFYENKFEFHDSNVSVKETAEKLDTALKVVQRPLVWPAVT